MHGADHRARPDLAQRQARVGQALVGDDEEDEHRQRRDEHREPVGDDVVRDESGREPLQEVEADRPDDERDEEHDSEPAMKSVARNLPRRNERFGRP